MIKDKNNVKYWKTSYNLEQDIKEQERELNALKKVYELNDINALNMLPLKNLPKTKRNSVRIPKKLIDEKKERRKELQKLKEIEELNKIQMTLFKDIKMFKKKNNKLEPISQRNPFTKKNYCQTEDFFAINLNKECDNILNGNKKNIIKDKNFNLFKTDVEFNLEKGNNNNNQLKKIKEIESKFKFKNETKEIKKIVNNKNEIINDEDKDKDFLNNLDNNLKNFYMTKTKEIFELLKEINLCRYIHYFLNDGYDLFEEFLELPSNYFDKMQKPFLNKNQQEKLYNKISLYKKNNININNNNINIKKEILSNNENTKEIKNDLNKGKKKIMSETGCDANIIIKKEIPKVKVDNSCNFSIENSLLLAPNGVSFCFNCLKPLKKENSIIKEYDVNISGDYDPNLFKFKYFCSENCVKIFEQEKEDKKINKTVIEKEKVNEIQNKIDDVKENEINKNSRNNEDNSLDEDNYDPMEDF